MDIATALPPEIFDPVRLRAELGEPQGDAAPSGNELTGRMRQAFREGRARVRERFEAGGGAEAVHRELTRQTDVLIQGALDYAEGHVYGTSNPSTGEELAVVAVGGYGRGELAPQSDVDLLFLHPYKRTPHVEQMAEFLLFRLYDLGLKVGHSVRSVAECVKLAKADLTVRTALLETRFVWGSPGALRGVRARLPGARSWRAAARTSSRPSSPSATQRHEKLGDSRFLLEPNIKEGKGGLRDLHTLMWIGRFLYDVREPGELVRHGVLTRQSLETFIRSRRFLWTVRCHLHYLAGRAEERLTFDLQPEIARRMGFRDRSTLRAVERFMKRYYLVATRRGCFDPDRLRGARGEAPAPPALRPAAARASAGGGSAGS